MNVNDDIHPHILDFIKTPRAVNLARSYHCEPHEAIGEIWLRLSHQLHHAKIPIRDVAKWVEANGYYILWTYVRKEARHRLHQPEGEL